MLLNIFGIFWPRLCRTPGGVSVHVWIFHTWTVGAQEWEEERKDGTHERDVQPSGVLSPQLRYKITFSDKAESTVNLECHCCLVTMFHGWVVDCLWIDWWKQDRELAVLKYLNFWSSSPRLWNLESAPPRILAFSGDQTKERTKVIYFCILAYLFLGRFPKLDKNRKMRENFCWNAVFVAPKMTRRQWILQLFSRTDLDVICVETVLNPMILVEQYAQFFNENEMLWMLTTR